MLLRKFIKNKYVVRKIQQIAVTDTNCRRTTNGIFLRHQSSSAATANDMDFKNPKLQKYLEALRQEFYVLRANAAGNAAAYERMSQIDGVVSALEQYRILESNISKQEDIDKEKDEDMRQLMQEENEVYSGLMPKTEQQIMKEMLTLADDEFYPDLIFEVNAGAGGQEAMLFAKELFDMYTNFFEFNNWEYEILAQDSTDIGGLRHANLIINDADAYNLLRYEGGVHRVQRVPATEKSGRIHTSTASIAVIPRPADVHINIAEKDLKIETKRASGAGGQHVNTTDSAVRIVHLPSGLAVESQTERSQIKNREIALKRLHAKLLQQQLESAAASTQASRKAQQGNLNRNEKIRTYNYVQDRITDHRIQNGTVHNLVEFLEGGAHLGSLIERIVLENRKAKLLDLINNWKETPVGESVKEQKQKS